MRLFSARSREAGVPGQCGFPLEWEDRESPPWCGGAKPAPGPGRELLPPAVNPQCPHPSPALHLPQVCHIPGEHREVTAAGAPRAGHRDIHHPGCHPRPSVTHGNWEPLKRNKLVFMTQLMECLPSARSLNLARLVNLMGCHE